MNLAHTSTGLCIDTPVVVLLHFCMLHTIRHHLLSHFILSYNVQWGYTPFLTAVLSGHADVARFLLESGSDVHEQANVSIMLVTCEMFHLVQQYSWSMVGLQCVFGVFHRQKSHKCTLHSHDRC